MLPGTYERWFAELCGRPSPVESRSTCDDCAMLPGAPDLPPEGPFSPGSRCCTYHPHLAPHFVGGILSAGTDAGRARVRARIAGRLGVTPLGLGPLPAYAADYARIAGRAGGFGRSAEIVCPFYDDARCTIWQHRGAVCAAFHCKLDRGALGAGLWKLIMLFFNVVERALARRLLERQGLDGAPCDALLRAPDDAALDARAWGAWLGREEEYFLAAAGSVESLSWSEVVAIGGADLARLSQALKAAVAHLDDAPPERVRRGDGILYQIGSAGKARLQNPGVPLDLLEIPSELADRLLQLGRDGSEIRLADLNLDADLMRRLLDWQALIPV